MPVITEESRKSWKSLSRGKGAREQGPFLPSDFGVAVSPCYRSRSFCHSRDYSEGDRTRFTMTSGEASNQR